MPRAARDLNYRWGMKHFIHGSRTPAHRTLIAATVLALGGCAVDPQAGSDEGLADEQIVACSHGSTVRGIDVSEFQGHVDWAAVHHSGVQFAIARVGDGTYVDPTFETNWHGIRNAGLIRGAYQFFEPRQDPVAQADILIRRVGRL
ncbi:MAG: glycoside hydrolase family 25 protein, partial [Thermoanaerobaculia bacterium]